MKNIAKKLISTVLATATVVSSILTAACSVGATETAAKDPKDIDRVVVDCRSAEAFAKTSKVYAHTPTAAEPDPYTGGKYSFNDIMNAMEVEYNSNATGGKSYRILTMFNEKNMVTSDYKYFVIVYAAKTTEPYRLSIWNGGQMGKEVNAVSNGKDTKTKFIVTEPFDISDADSQGRSTLSRWTIGSHSTISFITSDREARFFIKEYAFFKSPEDAKAYYEGVDLDKDPEEYGANAVGVTPAAPVTPAGAKLTDISYIKVEEPGGGSTGPEPILDPVIVSFESEQNFKKNGKFQTFDGNNTGLEGKQAFVTLEDGTKCMQILSHKFEGEPQNYFSDYRMMFAPAKTGVVTKDHKYVRVTYMTTDVIAAPIVIVNNKGGAKVTLASDASVSRGEFVRTNAADISVAGLSERYANGVHCSFEYKSQLADSKFYIKEIAFFTTEKQAYEYYGDEYSADAKTIDYTELLFGENGEGTANRDDPTFGNSVDTADTLDIIYAPKTNFHQVKYMAKIKPAVSNLVDATYRYIRILYSADNPEDVDTASMFLRCDGDGNTVLITDNVVDTNGEFVLTDPVYLTEAMLYRNSIAVHNSLMINALPEGGKYSIKAVYYFPTRRDAESFTLPSANHTVTIAGNDISEYQIVIGEDTTVNVKAGAESIAQAIKKLTGVDIPVVTDEAPETAYEILVGLSSRPLTYKYSEEMTKENELSYRAFIEDNKLVITSPLAFTTVTAANTVNKALFYDGAAGAPEVIDVPASFSINAVDNTYKPGDFWQSGDPVENPTVFTEDFDVNDGYFNEDNGEVNWKYENGAYKTDAADFASSYLHVYEKNVTYKAKLSYTAENDGEMGIMARVNSEDAYVKAGYDFGKGEWYIESRSGRDYYLERVASKAAEIAPDTVYELNLSIIGETATLTVNGETVFADTKLTHFSPGRIGVYAENASVTVDDIEITLVSGQGTILKNVAHTKLPDEVYREGGTVFERADGSLSYVHPSDAAFKSLDNGITWERTETWSDNHKIGYVNMFKLATGEWIRIVTRGTNKASQTSTDDGMTWTDGGIICETKYKGTTATAGNMNDKITQGADGRIYYVQAYESTDSTGHVAVEGRYVFCRYYFSDDKGMTWQKGADSWEIPGNDEEWFGENKLLECADGTIRMYCSWNFMGNIYYADSTDGGLTFGPLTKLEGFTCPTSSMQFVKDEYADNDHTYYMVWVNAVQHGSNSHTPRSRLSLAKTTDGKNWVYLGDIWRWEGTYLTGNNLMNHVVNPFIMTTEDYIICGSGFSEGMKFPEDGGPTNHQGQRQHIYSIRKDTLPEGKPITCNADTGN